MLVTRPRIDAERTAKRLMELGHEAQIDPVIEIEPLETAAPDRNFSAVVFTSANAVRVAASINTTRELPTFAVGPRTAEVAREHGFLNVQTADGDVVTLGKLIAQTLPRGADILHLAGEDRAGDLPGLLATSGIAVQTKVVYRARTAGCFMPETVVAFRQGAIDAVLHYSLRSATAFLRLAELSDITDCIAASRHLCLSSAVAAPLKSVSANVETAGAPEEKSLLGLLGA